MTSGGLGCCCCTCAALQAYLECDAITIPGFTRLGDWQNLSSGYDGNCCYRAFFIADDCQTLEVCNDCVCFTCAQTGGLSQAKYGYSSVIASGCVREVIIYRHFYGPDEQLPPCGPFQWCKWVVLAKWRDYRTVTSFIVYRRCLEPVSWPEFCPYSCSECVGDFHNCHVCAGTLDWWRIRTFDDLPQGTISFVATDILTGCLSKLKCVSTDVIGGIRFLTGQQCFTNWNIECDCLLPDPFCYAQLEGDTCAENSLTSAWCATPPPTWSIVFGEPC